MGLTTHHGRARRVLLAATFLIVAATLNARETDFRELRWGMTVDEVKEIEGAPRHEWDNNLAYAVRVAGLDAYLFLEFENGLLYKALYSFREEYVSNNSYLRDFAKVGDLLREVYGEPPEMDREKVWRETLFRDDQENWGLAVAVGHLLIRSRWETDRTIILHYVSGENYEVKHGISYVTAVADEERERRLREAQTEGL